MIMKYFYLEEFVRSTTADRLGINNRPEYYGEQDVYARIELLVAALLDPMRIYIAEPIYIKSGYRSQELNKAEGGVRNSQHRTGQAADIRISDITGDLLTDLFLELSYRFDYDQMIYYKEQDYIHISYVSRFENRHVAFAR